MGSAITSEANIKDWEVFGDIRTLAFHSRLGVVETSVSDAYEAIQALASKGEIDVSNPLLGDMEHKHWIVLDACSSDVYCAEAWLEWEDADTEGWPHSINAVVNEE